MAIVSDILQATPAPADGSPTPTRTWQWLRDGAAITSATSSLYTTVDADANRAITVRQTETNFMGATSATSIAFATVDPFEVRAALFSTSEPGGWYDPSDLTTMFQDSVGTTPVTATGQTVGLMLDKSKGLALGPELVTNGDFASATGWTLGAGWSIGGGFASIDGTNLATSILNQTTVATVVGRTYLVTYTYSVTAGAIRLNTAQFGTTTSFAAGTSGVYTAYLVAIGTTGSFGVQAQVANTIATIDNISVKELAGNHLTQATAASRPIYGIEPFGGRRNLLTRTEEFENAAWSKTATTVAANSTAAPDETITADTLTATGTSSPAAFRNFSSAATAYTFSTYIKQGNTAFSEIELIDQGTSANRVRLTYATGVLSVVAGSPTGTATNVGNGWWRVTITYTFPAIGAADTLVVYPSTTTGVIGDFCFLWGAQLETGSLATPYQRVTDQWNVTEAGKASVSYLAFDGTDDFLVSPTITPGIDKAQVFAGVRKLSDAAVGIVVESGTGTENGIFVITAPRTGGVGNYRFISKGTVLADAFPASGYSAPITNVLTGIGDIAADVATLRVNGTQVATSATDQGTGNYLAYPLYVGRRGGTSLPFNGRLYQMIVRFGANLDAAKIARTEQLINEKTGAIVPPVSTLSLDFIAQEYNYGL